MKTRDRHLRMLLLVFLLHAAPVAAQTQAVMVRSGLTVLPVFFVPSGEAPPTALQQTTLMRHLYWAQQRYYDMLGGRGTFRIASDRPEIYGASSPASFYRQQPEEAAPNFVDELLRAKNLTRINCPYVFLVVFMSAAGDFPNPSGGRPINGWMNEGGGVIIFSSSNLSAFNLQSTLRHELGHSFDLVHVDSYGYDMASNASIMSYNTAQWTNFLQDSPTPGILIPEDIRALAQNKLAFPALQFTSADVPTGYTIYPQLVVLPPMNLPNQPAYTAVNQYFSTDTVTQTVKVGDPVAFVASALGFQPSSYQWQLNGVAIPGATAAALTIANARPTDAGYYTAQVKGASGTPVTNMGVLNVNAPVPPSSAALNPTSASFGSPGGEGTFSLTIAPANANWSASSNVSWLTVPSGSAGTGNWTLVYSVAPNPSSAARAGQIAVAGATFSVNQAGSGAGTSITINNPGFETLPSNPQWIDCSGYSGTGCRYTGDGNVPGWTASGAGQNGLLQPGPNKLFTLPMPAAEGQTFAQINSGTLSQTLSATLQVSTTYTVQVDVGRRLDNLYPAPSPTAQLFAGSTPIASATGAEPLLGGWTTWTGTYQSSASDPLAGQALRIVLGATAAQGDFDNVRLSSWQASAKPVVSANGVVNGASFLAGVVPGSFATIFGTNLASTTTGKGWDGSITNGQLPTQIDGVSVSIGGKPAYIAYIRQDQINIQVPDAGVGPMQVTVTNSLGTSAPVTVTSQQFGPAFFLTGGKYAVAQHYPDYGYSANPSVVAGTVAAKPGDILILWGTGFGPTNPAVPAGQVPPPTAPTVTGGGAPVTVTVGGVNAQLISAVLSPYAADYQIAIKLPLSLPNGDVPIKASIASYQSPDNVYIYVHN